MWTVRYKLNEKNLCEWFANNIYEMKSDPILAFSECFKQFCINIYVINIFEWSLITFMK